ncbi:MFS transporter [Paraoerskovia marina]|uniref:MFS transporter n=1 Tax=Paraoerskovia marina TaxID=545619 RepID=UPI000492DE5A|nr:MFS transporter [Paraoerskovia marina]
MTRTPAPTHADNTTMRAAYAELPALAGRAFLPIAFVARLPFSMIAIGVMLLVTDATGSIATGGIASAASALGTAVGGPTQGALADRFGQRVVLLVSVPAQTLALVALVVTVSRGEISTALVAAALAGALAPQIGPLARGRWMGMARGKPRALAAAMSYESTADEVSFVLGPALVGILSAAASPSAALLTAAAVTLVFGLAFALHPTADAARTHRLAGAVHPGSSGVRALLPLAVPVVGMMAMGAFFGSTQAAVTAFTREAGSPDAAGLVYAVMGLGSAVTALATVALPDSLSQRGRWIAFSAGLSVLAVATAGLATGVGIAGLSVSLLLLGLFVGPVMVTIFTVGSNRAPVGRGAVAMTSLASANVVGVAAGSAVGGIAGESSGATAAFWIPALCATALLVIGVASQRRPPSGAR